MQGISRRRLLGYGLAAGAAVAIPWAAWPSAGYASAGGKLAKYVQQVPLVGSGIVVARQTPRTCTRSPDRDQPAVASRSPADAVLGL
jgi:hypothetical protein